MFQSKAHARWLQLSQGGDGDLRTIAARWLEDPEPDDGTAAVEAIKLRFAIDRALWAFDRWLESEMRLIDAVEAGILPRMETARAFDPDKHPRWPAGAPASQGGEFAPAGRGVATPLAARTPAQRLPLPGKPRPPKPPETPPPVAPERVDPKQLEERLKQISPLLDLEKIKEFAGQFAGEDRRRKFTPEQREQQRRDLKSLLDTLDSANPALTADEKTRYVFYYAVEGGMELKGGIIPGMFSGTDFTDRLKAAGLPQDRASITPENLTAYYGVVEDHMLRKVRAVAGRTALAEINDEKLRIAFMDAQFLNGATGGAESIREAINAVLNDREVGGRARALATPVSVSGIVTEEDFNVYKALANSGDPAIVRKLRKTLAAARIAYRLRRKRDPARGRINHLAKDD